MAQIFYPQFFDLTSIIGDIGDYHCWQVKTAMKKAIFIENILAHNNYIFFNGHNYIYGCDE